MSGVNRREGSSQVHRILLLDEATSSLDNESEANQTCHSTTSLPRTRLMTAQVIIIHDEA